MKCVIEGKPCSCIESKPISVCVSREALQFTFPASVPQASIHEMGSRREREQHEGKESPLQASEKMQSSYGICILYIGENEWMFRIQLEKIFYSGDFFKNPLLKRIWKNWSFWFSEMLKKKEIQPKTVEETVKVLGGKINQNKWFFSQILSRGRVFLLAEISLSAFCVKAFRTDSLLMFVPYWGSFHPCWGLFQPQMLLSDNWEGMDWSCLLLMQN